MTPKLYLTLLLTTFICVAVTFPITAFLYWLVKSVLLVFKVTL